MTTVAPVLSVEDGQFDDAPEDVGYAHIDDAELIDLTSDEDWEVAEKDFTKRYNRLRQHLVVWSGSATSTATTTPSKSAARKAASTVEKDQRASQFALLSSNYGSRIANMDHSLGVGVNRKGASAHATLKNKADRATTGQVLDARTRVVLLKMVGRGIVAEINAVGYDDHKDYDIDIEYYDYKDKDYKGKQCTWEPVFENRNDWGRQKSTALGG
ncbi:hypothetical protein EDD85DRAFT_1002045 [Armillaria nabsnona]|nr:hypothetical protein EDD85DRAFT_1002045 [Armillaria nabsnona]